MRTLFVFDSPSQPGERASVFAAMSRSLDSTGKPFFTFVFRAPDVSSSRQLRSLLEPTDRRRLDTQYSFSFGLENYVAPTSTSTTTASTTEDPSLSASVGGEALSEENKVIVIACVVGGVIFIAIIAVVVYVVIHRHSNRDRNLDKIMPEWQTRAVPNESKTGGAAIRSSSKSGDENYKDTQSPLVGRSASVGDQQTPDMFVASGLTPLEGGKARSRVERNNSASIERMDPLYDDNDAVDQKSDQKSASRKSSLRPVSSSEATPPRSPTKALHLGQPSVTSGQVIKVQTTGAPLLEDDEDSTAQARQQKEADERFARRRARAEARRKLKALVEAKSSPKAYVETKKTDKRKHKKKLRKQRRESKRQEQERLSVRAQQLKRRLSEGGDTIVVRGRSPMVRLEAKAEPTSF